MNIKELRELFLKSNVTHVDLDEALTSAAIAAKYADMAKKKLQGGGGTFEIKKDTEISPEQLKDAEKLIPTNINANGISDALVSLSGGTDQEKMIISTIISNKKYQNIAGELNLHILGKAIKEQENRLNDPPPLWTLDKKAIPEQMTAMGLIVNNKLTVEGMQKLVISPDNDPSIAEWRTAFCGELTPVIKSLKFSLNIIKLFTKPNNAGVIFKSITEIEGLDTKKVEQIIFNDTKKIRELLVWILKNSIGVKLKAIKPVSTQLLNAVVSESVVSFIKPNNDMKTVFINSKGLKFYNAILINSKELKSLKAVYMGAVKPALPILSMF